jgi:hypothetical protein
MPKQELPNLNNFEIALTGGHPNSLGNTILVVEEILKNPKRIQELFDCYFSSDEIVRMRVSNAFKRIAKEKPELVVPFLDLFISKISKINQASTQWTFAQLFMILDKFVSEKQRLEVVQILKNNLVNCTDWIVLNFTMEALVGYSRTHLELKPWLKPHLEKLTKDTRKSVAARANKYLKLV